MKRSEQAAKLEAEAKALRRAEKAFLQEASNRKAELLEMWGIDTLAQHPTVLEDERWKRAADMYGIDTDTLYAYVTSDRQVMYF